MDLMNSFNNFYRNLSTSGIFFFWIVIFLFIFLVILSIILIKKNKKLLKALETKSEEPVIASNLNTNINENITDKIETKNEVKQEVVEELKAELPITEKEEKPKLEEKIVVPEETGPYQKNVLREISARTQTSPIHIEKKEEETILPNRKDTYQIDLGEDALSPLAMMEDTYELNDNMKFASEIVERMEEEIKPSNIELTDYEKKEEEEAIISYDELLKVKDKIYNISEDEETDEFIDELKSFRLDLQ